MIFRKKVVVLVCSFALAMALMLTLAGCDRPAANTAKPPTGVEQPTAVTTPGTPNSAQQKGLIVRVEDLSGARGGSRSARLDRAQEVYESWSDAIRLDLSGDFSFNKDDLTARIKVDPEVDYRIEVVQEPWAAITIPLTKDVIRVTIAAKPTDKGQPFDYDRSIEIRRGLPRTMQITSSQYPEVTLPGGYGFPPGKTRFDFSFSHPVDRQQFAHAMNQTVAKASYTWSDDQHVSVEFDLPKDSHLFITGSQFSDKSGVPFADDTLQIRGVSERPVKLITGPGKSQGLVSLDSLVLGAWLSPDGKQLLHARAHVPSPGEGPPRGTLRQLEINLQQQNQLIPELEVYLRGELSWTNEGEYWLLPGRGLGLDTNTHLYDAQGRERKSIPTAVATNDLYRLRYSVLSPTGDTISYLVMDAEQISQGPFVAKLSPNTLHVISSIDGRPLLVLPEIVWSQNYERTWRPRLLTYTPDGKRIVIGGWVTDEQGGWLPRIREVDITTGHITVRGDLPNPFLTDKGELQTLNPAYAWDYLRYAPTGDRYLVKSDLGLNLVDHQEYGRINERVSPPTYEIRSMAGDTLATIQVDAMEIVWAPDGRRIAFLGSGTESFGRKLWVFDLETQQLTAWTEQDIVILAGWGPDGIVVVEDAPGGE